MSLLLTYISRSFRYDLPLASKSHYLNVAPGSAFNPKPPFINSGSLCQSTASRVPAHWPWTAWSEAGLTGLSHFSLQLRLENLLWEEGAELWPVWPGLKLHWCVGINNRWLYVAAVVKWTDVRSFRVTSWKTNALQQIPLLETVSNHTLTSNGLNLLIRSDGDRDRK